MTKKEELQDKFIEYLLSILTPECKTLYKAIKVDGFKQSISQLQEGEMYPREFVEWCIAHCDPHGGTEYWNEQEEIWVKATFEQIFEYWQSKVKNEKK